MTEGVPLREALKLAPLQQARVVAGAAGLDRTVCQVNVMEVPDILPWVKPRQLLLTTAYPLRDKQAALTELVPGLAARGLAGLAIKPARYIEAIPRAMVEAADRLDFPLIELPADASFDEVINAVLGSILNAQAVRLQRSAAIHDRFTRIVLGGGGLREIAQALAELIGQPAAILDPAGTILAASSDAGQHGLGPSGRRAQLTPGCAPTPQPGVPAPTPQPPPPRAGEGEIPGTDICLPLPRARERGLGGGGSPTDRDRPHHDGPARLLHASLSLTDSGAAVVVAVRPIQVDGERHGSLVVAAAPDDLDEDARVALEQAATIAALRLVQARALSDADRRFRAVCLEELVAGHVVDRGVLQERALAFGWELSAPRAVLVAELEALAGRRFSQLAGTPEEGRAWHRLAEAVTSALGKDAIVWERSAGVAALIAPGRRGRAALLDAAAALQAEAARQLPGSVVSVGIGRTCDDPLDLARSHREALRAVAVGGRTRGPGHVSLFEDLGLDRLLAGCADGELAAFRDTTLGALVAYDAVHQTELLRTLEAYLAASGNATVAAEALFVHYNTLRHRLRTIEQVVGLSLDDAEARLSLGLALRVRRMLPR